MSSTSNLVTQLNSVTSQIQNEVSEKAQKVHVALDKIDATVNNVAKKIDDLRTMIVQGSEKQLAHENLLRVEQQINDKLKHYLTVRRTVLGVIKDFDFNLVRGSTIEELSEEIWMSSSRYWLSYVQIAISAWIQGSEESKQVCQNAISEAMRRDANKTSLFFCLLNLRLHKKDRNDNRDLVARKWLYEYFASVDSLHPPRETVLVLRAFLAGIFGRDSQLNEFVNRTVREWVDKLSGDSSISAGLVEGYNKYISTLPSKKSDFSSDVLDSYCETVKEMQASLVEAGRYNTALERLSKLDTDDEITCGKDFIQKIDSLLEDLVNNYDEEERRLENEKKFYTTIMEHGGNVEAAKKDYEAYVEANKEEPNIGEQMFRWAVYPDKGISVSIQKFAVQKTKVWYENAIDTYDHNLKSKAPGAFKLSIDLWSETIDGKDREATKNSLRNKFESEKSHLLIFTKPNVAISIVALTLLILGIVFGIAAENFGISFGWYGFIVGPAAFAILALVVVLKTVIKMKAFPRRIKNAEVRLEACLDAIDEYRTTFDNTTALKDEIIKKLEYI